MRTEIMSAVDFLSNLLRTRQLDSDLMESFKQNLNVLLCTHYQNHWFPEKPFKGSAYRCLRIVNQKMDPLLTKAGHSIGLSESSLLSMLPAELTMWVDPDEVSYRIGEDGSIGVLFEFDENTSLNSAGDSPTSESDSDSSLSADTSESEDPTQEILQTCKNEQRHFRFPGVSEEPMNLEYFAQYVSSS